jgi:hypothetical protein
MSMKVKSTKKNCANAKREVAIHLECVKGRASAATFGVADAVVWRTYPQPCGEWIESVEKVDEV